MRLSIKPLLMLVGFGLLLLLRKQSAAVPQFARRYNVKRSAPHDCADAQ